MKNNHIEIVNEFLKKNDLSNYIIDSHSHIHFDAFKDNLKEILDNAKNHHIGKIVTIGTENDSHINILPMIEKYKNIYGTVGIHPCSAYSMYNDSEIFNINNNNLKSTKIYDYLMPFANNSKIVGFGETGLDFYVTPMKSSQIQQEDSFRQHIAAGKKFDLPLVIHTRNAEKETIKILQDENFSNGIFHCFTSSQWLADKGIELGLYISFSGIITFKNSHELRDIVKNTPIDKIIIETDAPYLSPEPMRKIQRNEPYHLIYTAAKIAEIHEISIDEVIKITTKNCKNIFKRLNDEI